MNLHVSPLYNLKLLQIFFSEFENTQEIRRSPFRSLSVERRRIMMHVMYDAPIFPRAEEVKLVMVNIQPLFAINLSHTISWGYSNSKESRGLLFKFTFCIISAFTSFTSFTPPLWPKEV